MSPRVTLRSVTVGHYDTELQEIAEICRVLGGALSARAVLLFDRSGQFVTSHGDVAAFNGDALAALIAAHMASTRALGEVISESFESAHHEGEKHNLYLSSVSGRAILAIITEPATRVGSVRVRARVVVQKLDRIVQGMLEKQQAQGTDPNAPGRAMETGGIPGISRSML